MFSLFVRDIKINTRSGGGTLTALIFFLSVLAAMLFGFGFDSAILSHFGSSIVWISIFFSSLCGLERLFQTDQEDGSLALMLLYTKNDNFIWIVFVKCLALWVSNILPIIVFVPFIAALFSLDSLEAFCLTISLLVGTPGVIFIGAVAACAAISFSRSGFLIFILIFPFIVPILIFGISSSHMFISESDNFFYSFLFLCFLTIFFAFLGPVSAALILEEIES